MPTTWTAERVKALRVFLGLSQSQFAARLGCHVRAVSQWERSLRVPTGLYAKALDDLDGIYNYYDYEGHAPEDSCS